MRQARVNKVRGEREVGGGGEISEQNQRLLIPFQGTSADTEIHLRSFFRAFVFP